MRCFWILEGFLEIFEKVYKIFGLTCPSMAAICTEGDTNFLLRLLNKINILPTLDTIFLKDYFEKWIIKYTETALCLQTIRE